MDEETVDDVRDNVDKILIQEAVEALLLTLTEREAYVLRARFFDLKTFRQIGKQINLSSERIRQHHSKAIRKLRQPKRMAVIRKLGIPWLHNALAREKEVEKAREIESNKEAERYYREIELRWQAQKERHAERERFKYDHHGNEPYLPTYNPKIETAKPTPKPEPSEYCPRIVILQFTHDAIPYLSTLPIHGYNASIERSRDPETYDRWLAQRLKEHESKN